MGTVVGRELIKGVKGVKGIKGCPMVFCGLCGVGEVVGREVIKGVKVSPKLKNKSRHP